MKFIVLAIILLSLYLIYRLSFLRQAGNRPGDETSPPPEPPDGYKAVVKSRFVLPDRSNSTQHADRKQESDKQEENASIFAAGNEKSNAVIPPEELGEVFAEDAGPDDLDIEPDASEKDNDDELDAEEETARQVLPFHSQAGCRVCLSYSQSCTWPEFSPSQP